MKIVLFSCCWLLAFGLSAQTSPIGSPPATSQVDMSPDELRSLVAKFIELRKRRLALMSRATVRRTVRTVNREATNNSTAEVRPSTTDTAAVVRTDTLGSDPSMGVVMARLDRQEALLRQLLESPLPPAVVDIPPSPSVRDTVVQRIISRAENSGTPLSREDLRELSREVANLNDEIGRLRNRLRYEEDRRRRAEIDLQRQLVTAPAAASRKASVGATQPMVIVRDTVVRRDTVVVEKEVVSPVVVPVSPVRDTVIRRDTVLRQDVVIQRDTVVRENTVREEVILAAREPIGFPAIFFDNNSATLNAAHRELLTTAAAQLRERPGYVVRLTGYASPSGNAAYNLQLSERRARAVLDGLTAAGVAADRILVVTGGIDYQPANAAAARRVEVQAIPR